jgi:mannose-1-phosphate guanylyltransferase
MIETDHLFAVILAGGSGTRFWPASRRLRPKQLLAIGPDPERSLIAATVSRIAPRCPPERTLVATGEHLLDATRRALPELPESSFLAEPVARNTAPCIGWAAAIAEQRRPGALVMVLPSDHHVADEASFLDAVSIALESARGGAIATIGITPDRAETGYGYIEAGAELGGGAREVVRFVEKPDRERAEQYLASGRHFWNAGMFFFRAGVMLEALRMHAPEIRTGVDRMLAAGSREAERQAFSEMPSISIDYAVMEKASPLTVVPASFGWSDLGSWQSAWELGAKDPGGNVAPAGAVLLDARGNLVASSGGKLVALVGVEDLCVVETEDALLVMPRARAQEVRRVVDALGERGRDDLV